MQVLIAWSSALLCAAIIGYIVSVGREKQDLMNHRVVIKSKAVTQKFMDELDLKMFRLGKVKLFVGDEIRLKLKNRSHLRGVVLGAKKQENALCLVTSKDEIVEVKVTTIDKLNIVTKYGRLF